MIQENSILTKESLELLEKIDTLHPTDIAKYLKKVKKESVEEFQELLSKIPEDYLGEVLLELPENTKELAYESLSIEQLTDAIEELETDDATDIIQEIAEYDQEKADEILNSLEEEDQQDIKWLQRYEDDVAGAFMQTELFSAKLNETLKDSIKRLRKAKENDELENIHQVYIVDDNENLINAIYLEDLIIHDFSKTYKEILKTIEVSNKPISVSVNEDIDEVVKIFEQYDLSVIAVVGYKGRLLGRITSDDIIDIIEQNATDQMYQLAGVGEDYDFDDNVITTTKKRGVWLFVNLFTAMLAASVVGLFEATIESLVALAILMPVVASMGGNAGTQALATMIRQLALGKVDDENSKEIVKKEVFVAISNGLIFGVLAGIIASLWFGNFMLGVVILLAMIANLLVAGFFGSVIPIVLKKLDIDPAVGSSVVLTTLTDVVGFFAFLGIATILLIN
ncbi:magnesium transporter [Arcobacter sp. FWKO B]|uniref:magnesium transporter n=1 Tax=Arcobacter sp. FWKO B TaxID=2593672 RepID=UPI0018A6131F|nr:magnesium transporter [Arcobacter sp. FWKO B]QOG11782.1 magnesium transporter [Arcobacter sp. FWKO B]